MRCLEASVQRAIHRGERYPGQDRFNVIYRMIAQYIARDHSPK
jgi:hypothetical protein